MSATATRTENYRSISTTEAAKLIRARLKTVFPEYKFKVRSSKYSGGSSIDVQTTIKREDNRELWEKIQAELEGFQGKDFDGMIDMSFYRRSWLNPDGSAVLADHSGTTGSAGVISPYSAPAPDENSELVWFHSDHVHLSYDWSAK
ncbi:LPD29 domain-containing protein [Sinorhizobium meliloti]|uniref:LPD29 domain-containing protein n=1 Tax=Rhizobium meliloti TaxID=382 RepID=UPI00299DA085|nr:hypothetical protein [Sinorhizobium meliloti]